MTMPSKPNLSSPTLLTLARAATLCLVVALLAGGCKPSKSPPKPPEAAYKAVCDGKLNDLRKILDKRKYRNMELDDGSTLFHVAAMRGHRDIVEYLLPSITNINLPGPGSLTALHLAAAKGHVDLVRFFLDQGAEPDSGSRDNRTPLHMAASEGRTDIVRLLLDKGADINARDGAGFTPLHWAAIKGQKDMVELLLERDADFTAESRKGRTPLWYASIAPAVEAVLEKKRDFRRVAVLCESPADAGPALAAAAVGLEQLIMFQLQGFRGVVTYTPQDARRAWLGGTNAPAQAPAPERWRALAEKLEADRILCVQVTSAGQELAVDAQLYDAAKDIAEPLLSTRVKDASGLATLDEKLAFETAARLDVTTSGSVVRVSTADSVAFGLFAEGAQLLAGEPMSDAGTTNRNLAEAGAAFAAAAAKDPACLAAALGAARVLFEIRRLDPRTNIVESVSPYMQAANLAASNQPAIILLTGLEKAARGNSAAALRDYDRALALNRHLTEARFERALVLRSQQQLDDAIGEFLQVLRLRPNQARTYAELGLTLAHNNNWQNAVTQCEKAIELDQHIPEVYSTLATAHWQLKNYEYAWKTIKLAKHFGHEDAISKKFIEQLKKDTPKPEDKNTRR